jgi:hypothetical protein
MSSEESVRVPKCPLCGKGHLVIISYNYVPVVGFAVLMTNEVRKILVTCPQGKGSFILPLTVPKNADPISVNSVTNI